MINNVSKLTFKADKKPVLPQKNEQVSLLKIYNQGDKATLSTEESKKPNPPAKKHLFSLRNITVASFLVLGSVMLFAVLRPADITKSWENAKEKVGKIKTKIVEFFKDLNSSGNDNNVVNSHPNVDSGASQEAGGFVKDSLGKIISTISTIFTKATEKLKEKAAEEIKVIQTALDDVLKKEGDSGTPASKKLAGWVKAPLEKISSVISEISTKTKQTFVEVKIKINKFLKKPEFLKEKAVVVKKEAPKVSVKLDVAAEKAKAEVTQLTEKLENKTIIPETFVDNALNAIEKQTEDISSTVQEAVQLNSDKTLKSIDSAGVAKFQSEQAQVKEVTSSVAKPIIDMAGKKLTGKQLETAGQELIAKADNITDKVVRIEEVFYLKADDVSKSLKAVNSPTEKEIKESGKKVEEACNQAVKELHASGESEKAKLFAEQYEGLVERANPVIVDEKRVLTAEAKKLVKSLDWKNKKIAAFKTLIEAKDAKKDFIEIQSAYNKTIAELKQAGATEQAKSFETYFKPKLESLESASIAKATKTTKSKAVNAVVERSSKASAELKPEISKQSESLAKGTKVEAEVIKTATESKPKVQAELPNQAEPGKSQQAVKPAEPKEVGRVSLGGEENFWEKEMALRAELNAKEVKTVSENVPNVQAKLPKQAESVKSQQDLAKHPKQKEVGRLSFEPEENLMEKERALQAKWNNL